MKRNFFLYAAVSGVVCALLWIHYGRYIQLSGDFVMHFMLVDELMKHGMRRPEAHMGIMNIYPDGAHWLAATIGWIGGSGLVAIVLITVASVFVCYLLLLELVGKESPVKVGFAVVVFLLLARTHSLIGWEVSVNYFYSQLVANVVLLVVLLALARVRDEWNYSGMVFIVAVLAMFVHALIALQILASTLVLIAWSGLTAWREQGKFPIKIAGALIALGVGALVILKFHPAFRAMRQAAENDGYLEFTYSAVLPVVVLCGVIGVVAVWRGRDRLGVVVGCAGLATALLALAQYVVLHVDHAGSNYAVKKHMFVVVTLAAVNVVRLIGGRRSGHWSLGWIVSPVLAGLASLQILALFNTPVVPVLRAVRYANYMAQFGLPGFQPGNTVAYDKSLPPMINFMISTTAFQQPFGAKQTTWIYGADPTTDATYAMVKRIPEIDTDCATRYGETSDYVVIPPSCMKK